MYLSIRSLLSLRRNIGWRILDSWHWQNLHFSCGRTGNELENSVVTLEAWKASDLWKLLHTFSISLGFVMTGLLE